MRAEYGFAGGACLPPRDFSMTEADFADIRHLLPESVLGMIQVAGLEAAFALIKRYGGTHFPIGKNQTKAGKLLHAMLADEVGDEAAARALVQQIRSLLADDLNTPAVIKAIDEWADSCNAPATDPGDAITPAGSIVATAVDALMGVKIS